MASKSLLDMHAEFVHSGYYRFLLPSRLTQDALENLFSQIRGHGDSHPTPVKFRHNIRLISISQFTKTPKTSSYSASDDVRLAVPLLRCKSRMNDSHDVSELVETNKDIDIICSHMDAVVDICESNSLAYLAGWIALKLKSNVCCDECVNWLVKRESSDGTSVSDFQKLQLTLFKSYGGSHYGLTLPSQNLLNFLFSTETIFCSIW